MVQMNEPVEAVLACRGLVAHVHVADGATRAEPLDATTNLRPFFAALKAIGYTGRVSVECAWRSIQDNAEVVRETLARQWSQA